jgi:hypothetical protein
MAEARLSAGRDEDELEHPVVVWVKGAMKVGVAAFIGFQRTMCGVPQAASHCAPGLPCHDAAGTVPATTCHPSTMSD